MKMAAEETAVAAIASLNTTHKQVKVKARSFLCIYNLFNIVYLIKFN